MPAQSSLKTGVLVVYERAAEQGTVDPETDTAAWVVAAMARDLPDLWHRPDDAGPRTMADIGAACFRAWGADAGDWH
jgi:hypothetical protein